MNNNIRFIVSIGIILLVVIFLYLIIFQRDFLFARYSKVIYSDGCVEKYKDGVAITPLCVDSRYKIDINVSVIYDTRTK